MQKLLLTKRSLISTGVTQGWAGSSNSKVDAVYRGRLDCKNDLILEFHTLQEK